MQERRRFNRCKLEQETEVLTEINQREQGMLLDVSVGGMKILLNRKPELGSKLSGQFKIIPHLGPFFVQGEVVWVKPVNEKGAFRWQVGVKFTKVNTIPG